MATHDDQPDRVEESLGPFVRAVRRRTRLSVNQLAEKMERSPTWLYRLETNDRADPQTNDLDAIAAACNLSTYETRYLYLLADKVPPAVGLSDTSMADYLEFFGGPALWIDGNGTSLYNAEFRRIFKGIDDYRDIVHWHYSSPDAKRVIQNWEQIAGWWVGVARHYLAYGGSTDIISSVKETMQTDAFRQHWQQQTIPQDPATQIWFVNDIDNLATLTIEVRLWIQPYRNGVLLTGAILDSSS